MLREIPVGALPPGEDTPPAAPPPPVPPEPALSRVIAGSAPAVTAGFWRRFGALATDFIIIMIVLSTFGLQSCGPRAGWNTTDHYDGKDLTIKDVSLSRDGITVKDSGGQVITLDKDGVSAKNYTRTQTRSKGFDTGLGARSRKVLPIKMLLWGLYCGVLIWRFGATPGMKIMKLKLVDFPGGGPLPMDKAFLRAFFSLVSLFLFLGYLWAILEKDRRTWHDIIAGTKVVKI